MDRKALAILNVVTSAFGVVVLFSAFIVLAQYAILAGVAKGETGVENAWATWLMLGTLFGGLVYLVALGMLALRPRKNCRWCLCCLIGYAIYVAAMIGIISWGDFAHQVNTYGLVSALSDNVAAFLYIAAPLIFVVLLIFKKWKTGV